MLMFIIGVRSDLKRTVMSKSIKSLFEGASVVKIMGGL